MAIIIRGTTPTITFKFNIVKAEELTAAYLTFKQGNTVVLQKTFTDATLYDSTHGNALAWTLTQQETLDLYTNPSAKMMLNWKALDGTRGASEETTVLFADNHIPEVI